MRVSILIPVSQEEANIEELLKRVLAFSVESVGFDREMVVCEDGWRDGTAEAMEGATRTTRGVRGFGHAVKGGKGAGSGTLRAQGTGGGGRVEEGEIGERVT